MYPKLTVSLSSSGDSPSSLILDHSPPLPVEIMSEIKIEKIGPSFQNLLNSCIQANVKSKVEVCVCVWVGGCLRVCMYVHTYVNTCSIILSALPVPQNLLLSLRGTPFESKGLTAIQIAECWF